MRAFDFYTPTYIHFGENAELEAGRMVRRFGGSRTLLVSGGQSARRSGLLDRVAAALEAEGVAWTDFPGAQPNPLLSHAEAGVRLGLAKQCDFILAVGGGSAIDTAKAIAHGMAHPDEKLWDVWTGKVSLCKTIPVGVVLTIPAAGSEMSDSAVLTNQALETKRGLNTDYHRPVFALMNPALALDLPWYQKACGVTDIMMHTLDRYFNPVWDNELTDAIAVGLLRTVIANGRALKANPENDHAMSEIMWCGSLSHNNLTGLGGQKDFSTHQLGHAISAAFDVTHGASLSAVWASWARYVMPSLESRFASYARQVWDAQEPYDRRAADLGIDATERFFAELGMPVRLHELEIPVEEATLEKLANLCSYDGTRVVGTFRKLNQEEILEVYRMAR